MKKLVKPFLILLAAGLLVSCSSSSGMFNAHKCQGQKTNNHKPVR